ncbi:hypothetical protein CEUSTIGMA_g6167.t1 [Chlamydomonas eustigma]|uniref:Uncharacterized protein n=1 Tax=Chlamydomonas eustigma TaxID=1157962 RepID=A0A250X7J2_9CHLO|nr:hypothetical protein CEUSTIGMA_g6167.t1 [Chlamydomonas eustigma]|eukprot:GAX78730.1 hypothetical protein CEUSTIGMA_g6167.t1 [Chlamydomonas eustigma]
MFVVGILGAGAGVSIGAVANVFRNGNKGRDRLKQELQETKSQLLDFEIKARALELDRKESQDIADRCLAEKEIQQEKVQHLEVDKQALETKLAVLQEESTAQAHRHDEDFKVLKAKVADVLTRLISKAIDVQGATDELQDLGCTIELEESSEDARACGVLLKERDLDAAWNGETDLLLANRQRMERLVSHHLIAAAAACSAAPTPAWSNGRLSSAASAFFPLIREPASHPRLLTPMKAINSVSPQGVATPVSSATSSGLTYNATDTDISQDQRHHFQKTAIPYKLSASTTSEPAVIKFVYNAKVMPSKTVMQDHDLLHGGSSGFFTSTSPPTTHRDSFLDDSIVDALPGRSSGRDASTAGLRRR